MNLNDFSKWLQYNKEWKIEGGLNTFRTHCIYIYVCVCVCVCVYINSNELAQHCQSIVHYMNKEQTII